MNARALLVDAAAVHGIDARTEASDRRIVVGFLFFLAERASYSSTYRLTSALQLALRWRGDGPTGWRISQFLRTIATYPRDDEEAVLANAASIVFLSVKRGDAAYVVQTVSHLVTASQWPRLLNYIRK